ncbi:hypothetical protein RP20_CCG007371 [Aedes albopictus]|nr:hypothetical protein RP20_CCG007371 [Aedes albopictus]
MVARNKCCKGYVRNKNKCNPVCTTPCENSKCTEPNFCTCNEGFERLSNFRCIPHCEGCDNGFCIKPGYCQCNTGFYHAENGSCLAECNNCGGGAGYCLEPNVCLCWEGYELRTAGEERTCEPVCDDGCLNGACTGPNQCSCDEGYVKDELGRCVMEITTTTTAPCEQGFEEINGTCIPICDKECVDGECAAPNQCECFEGYSNENSTDYHQCLPVCTNGCQNGDCIAPGKCICHKGYGKIADECIPLCEKCSLGHCVRPEECVCDRGYDLIEGDCVPICEEECKNAKCTGPNSCTCLPGYNYTDINSLFECLPVCEDDCENGACVAPNTCECNPGYTKYDDICFEPLVLCQMKCMYGHCDKDLRCHCDRGYIMNKNGECEKTCPDGCINGECLGGSCLCNNDYRLSLGNASYCEPICEDDYEYESGCVNGRCVHPNVCQCDDGYDFIDGSRTKCQSIEEMRAEKERQLCAKRCNNGVCEQGFCQCSMGYVNPDGDNHRCVAFCEPPCRNGTCVLPSRCECDQGFEFYNGSSHICLRVDEVQRFKIQLEQNRCEASCRNGNCEEGKCFCNVGFRHAANDEFNCQPYCEKPCLNGVCAGDNRCRCFEGYENANNPSQCDPICEPGCWNGHCVGPNECSCNVGFVPEEGSLHRCENELTKLEAVVKERQKLCKAKCSNGVCMEGICKCAEGFYNVDKTKMTCEPWCTEGCPNGHCTAPGECTCDEGYVYTEDHGCKAICMQDCVNGYCSEPGRCDCFPGFRRTADVNTCEPDCGEDGCLHGHCAAPGICECFAGYQQSEEDDTRCQLIPEIIYKVDSHSHSMIYNVAYVKYLVPLVVVAVLITAALITMIVLRNKRKDYHVGKLGNVRRSSGRVPPHPTPYDYNDYNLVVLFPTETKENCVYFMPQAPLEGGGGKDEEDKFSV